MTDHTTVSLKKELLNNKKVQETMDRLNFTSKSPFVAYAIRTTVAQEQGTIKQILQKILEKSNLSPEDYKQIVEEIAEEK